MTQDDPNDEVGKVLADLIAGLDAQLAGGGAVDDGPAPDLPADQLALYRQAREGLLRLEQAFPRPSATAPGSPTYDLLTGTGQVGKFRIRRELGRGGAGIVFLAEDTVAGREVALKLPRLEALLDPDLRDRFLAEARLAVGLDHPGLVPVYEAGEVGAVCYIAAAYAGETTLAGWLDDRLEPVPVRTAAALVAALAGAVEYLHEHHILHRDIKPSNVLLARVPTAALPDPELAGPGVPRLTDFGLAKLLGAAAAPVGAGGPTTGGMVVGTAEYMAPEQADGRADLLTRAADVYALGAVLCELLTGHPPFRGRNRFDTLRKILSEDPVGPRRRRPDVPHSLDAVCLKCLEKGPARRYASAGHLADDLRRFLGGQRPLARPAPWWAPAWKWARRRPAPATLVALAAALPFVLAGAWYSYSQSIRKVQAEELHQALYTATPANLPPVVARLRDYLPLVGDVLRRKAGDEAEAPDVRLRAALVVAPDDPAAAAYLRERAREAEVHDLPLIFAALADRRAECVPVWAGAFRDPEAPPGQRLRAASALAQHDPGAELWATDGDTATDLLIAESPLTVLSWARLFAPVRAVLRPRLGDRSVDPTQSASSRWVAAAVLAEWYADDPPTLLDLLSAGTAAQFPAYFLHLRRTPNAVALLEERLARAASVPPAGSEGARVRANLAIALHRLGRPEAAAGQLGGNDPRGRYHLIHGLGPVPAYPGAPAHGPLADVADPRVLAGSLSSSAPQVQSALLVALGDYPSNTIPGGVRRQITAEARGLYSAHPDPGVHSAAGWMLRQWGESLSPVALGYKEALARSAGWYTTASGATLAVIRPPDGMTSPFAIGTTEVTTEEYRRALGLAPGKGGPPGEPTCPVSDVSFLNAALYCNRLSASEGLPASEYCYEIELIASGPKAGTAASVRTVPGRTGYRLPTEIEWEYACRAGTTSSRYFGDGAEYLPKHGWYLANSDGRARPVGLLRPSPWGLFDVYGNVSEWCSKSPSVNESTIARACGGSWKHPAEGVCSDRWIEIPRLIYDTHIGFRVARTISLMARPEPDPIRTQGQ